MEKKTLVSEAAARIAAVGRGAITPISVDPEGPIDWRSVDWQSSVDWQARAEVAEREIKRLIVDHTCPFLDNISTRLGTLSRDLHEQTLPVEDDQKLRIIFELQSLSEDIRKQKSVHGALRQERDRLKNKYEP